MSPVNWMRRHSDTDRQKGKERHLVVEGRTEQVETRGQRREKRDVAESGGGKKKKLKENSDGTKGQEEKKKKRDKEVEVNEKEVEDGKMMMKLAIGANINSVHNS